MLPSRDEAKSLQRAQLQSQKDLGVTKQVMGPVHTSVWKRWADGRQVVIVGEMHELVFPTDEVVCEDGIVFLKWFRQQIEPHIAKWDIFLEARRTETREFELNPLNALQAYLVENPQLDSRVHWINLRTPIYSILQEVLGASLWEKAVSGDTKQLVVSINQFLLETWKALWQADFLTDKQISKVEYPQDRVVLRNLVSNRNKQFKLIVSDLLYVTSQDPIDLFELGSLRNKLLTVSNSLMELYLVARMLKPYVHNALVVCGDFHRGSLAAPLTQLGFVHVYPGSSPQMYLGTFSCFDMPNLSSEIAPHPRDIAPFPKEKQEQVQADDGHYRHYRYYRIADEKADELKWKKRFLVSQLRSAIRHPYLAHQMNRSYFADLSTEDILDLARKNFLDPEKVKKVLSEWELK